MSRPARSNANSSPAGQPSAQLRNANPGPSKRRGRPKGTTVPIERDPQRFEIAVWRALVGLGFGQFDAARRALLAVKGGEITMADIEGVLCMASAEIPLPQPFDPEDPDKGLRRLSAKAQRASPSSPWLMTSTAFIQGLITFISRNNVTGMCVTLDGLTKLGWGPVIYGLAKRIEVALGSNLPPADLDKLSPAVRRMRARLKGESSN